MKLEYKEFADKFGQWAPLFKTFIESEEMYKIYEKLKEDGEKELILPKSEDTFRVFASTSPDNVEVVWYLMDSYPKLYPGKSKIPQATGIALDCSNSPDGKLQPSLEKFYGGIEANLGRKVERSPCLAYLAEQGVMLINSSLTVKWRKTGSHEGLWNPFQKYFLEEVLRGKRLIYVLSGESSLEMEQFISPLGNIIIKTEHPMAAGYAKRDWHHDGVFNKINKILEEDEKHIFWNKEEFEEYCPF